MRILVTGGAGFLGSHLADRLVADGHEVVCIDNLSSGRLRNVERLAASGRFRFIEADVLDPLPPCGPLDCIYHLASPVPCACREDRPVATLRTAAEGTRRVLDLAAEAGAVFLLASSSEVYGNPRTHPQVETDAGRVSPVGPRSAYDEGKRFAEALAAAYARQGGVKVRIARIFNTFGPRMRPDDGRVIPAFIVQALAGRPLSVHGSGEQTRSFCYVSDMVEGLLSLAGSDYGGPVNLGNPDEVTILGLASDVLGLTGAAGGSEISNRRSQISIEFLPPRPDDPVRRRPDIGLAQRLLGWQPRVPRAEGLKQTIEYYRSEEPVA
ncbi:MAG: NAD-dependent epimerase/dehydratase family protein [Planctomycetes bacterium]|nr:NAD-dependent epimerase/dehydratase family protein [Planctomycetota bacterium]